ncbi:MAG: hypothetical protein JOZ72_00235 [Alphaproteobacteria bacterium]|nr:hypothetical protein [Alphaproteobacteria bacterium]
MFPVGIEGSIRLSNAGADPAPTLERIAILLDEAGETRIVNDGTVLRFDKSIMKHGGPIWLSSGGRFEVRSEGGAQRVVFSLRTVRTALLIAVAAGVPASFSLWNLRDEPTKALVILLAGWLWVFGINYLVASVYVRLWLRRGLRNLL